MSTPGEVIKALAARVRVERLQRGWSQSQMAAIARVSVWTYQRFEVSGSISFGHLVAVFDALGLLSELEQLSAARPGGTTSGITAPRPRLRAARRPRSANVSAAPAKPAQRRSGPARRTAAAVAPSRVVSPSPVAPATGLPTTAAMPGWPPAGTGASTPPPPPPGYPVFAVRGPEPFATIQEMPELERRELRQMIFDIVHNRMSNRDAARLARNDLPRYTPAPCRESFVALLNAELRRLTEADLERYELTADAFRTWRANWDPVVGVVYKPD